MFKSKVFVLAALLATLGGGAAYAQNGSTTTTHDNNTTTNNDSTSTTTGNDWHARFHEACDKDVQQFCSNVQAGGERLMKCLNQHESELSAGCTTYRTEARERLNAMRQEMEKACKDDMQKFCTDVKPGMGRMAMCLQSHENDLSQTCKDNMTSQMQRHSKTKTE